MANPIWPFKSGNQPPNTPAATAVSTDATNTAPAPKAAAPEPGLVIGFPKTFPLSREGNKILLPKISLSPVNIDLPPQITKVTITGASPNPVLKAWLTAAFAKVKFPAKLTQPVDLASSPSAWPQDQPIEVGNDFDDHRLIIDVEHKPTTAGRVSVEVVSQREVIKLTVGGSLAPTHRLTASPRHLVKVYEEQDECVGPLLTIRLAPVSSAQRGKLGSALKVMLSPCNENELKAMTANWGCPNLFTAIEQLLQKIAAAIKKPSPDGELVLELRPQFSLVAEERRALNDRQRKPDAQPYLVPIRVDGTGAVAIELILELIPLERNYVQLGKITFDLGTSSSLSIRHDPSYIRRSRFPREQMDQLRESLVRFLHAPPKDMLDQAESAWLSLLQTVCEQCGLEPGNNPAAALHEHLAKLSLTSESRQDDLFDLLRHLELQLWSLHVPDNQDEERLDRFQERVAEKLHEIYQAMFEKVPLEQWGVRLQTVAGESPFVVSELELLQVAPLPVGVMGESAAKGRVAWLTGKKQDKEGENQLQGRFIECPKRFQPHIHEDINITELEAWPVTRLENGVPTPVRVTPRQVLQAAWQFLIEKGRGELVAGTRGISEICMTYPADLMPEPRSQLEESLYEIGATTVHLLFDESTAPAIFHLEQLFGNMEEIGCESFKVSCVKERDIWTHHMLVFDLGAGTTDISLIRLELEEMLPRQSEFGGRLYIIRPRLLGAAGRHFSGGHQLTLKIFRVLKQMLARWIVQTMSDAPPASEKDASKAASSDEIVIDAENADDPKMKDALERAENVIETRFHMLHKLRREGAADATATEWDKERRKLDRFHLLWNWAEKIKIYLSDLKADAKYVPIDEALPGGFTNLKDLLSDLLGDTPYKDKIHGLFGTDGKEKRRPPDFKLDDFRTVAHNAVDRSVKLAISMAKSSLEAYSKKLDDQENEANGKMAGKTTLGTNRAPTALSLQSLVLSGRASALPAVRHLFRGQLDGANMCIADERILFRNEYAKSATAIGAWRGLHRYLSGREHIERPEQLNGKCEMEVQVQNLFFFLPTSYRKGSASNQLGERIFEQYSEFQQHGAKPLGIIRSAKFETPDHEVTIYRDDGDNDGILCGQLAKAKLLGLVGNRTNHDYTPEVSKWRVRYEINHQRKLYALLVRPSPDAEGQESLYPIYDIADKDENPYTLINIAGKDSKTTLAQAKDCPFHLSDTPAEEGMAPKVAATQMRRIRCLPLRTDASAAQSAAKKWIWGWLSEPVTLPSNIREGRVTWHLVNAKTNRTLQTMQIVPRPRKGHTQTAVLPFEVRYRWVITADGRCALIVGEEPNFWEIGDVHEWLTSEEGRILRYDMTPPKSEADWWRDHLSGRH